MKKNITRSVLLFVLILFSHYSFAARYYFSASGDDSRTWGQAQNPATPWKSIHKLNSIFKSLQPGDEILFKRGETFYGTIKISRSGAAGRPIKISAYGSGSKPTITSLVTLKDWKNVGNGVYESHHPSLGKDLNVVLVNNSMEEMGRYPNSDSKNRGYLVYEGSSWNSISSGGLASSSNWSGGEVVIRKNFWVIDAHKISSHSGKTIYYQHHPAATFSPSAGYGFFIQNHPNTLDKFGEWYYNPKTKNLRVFFGNSSPNSNAVTASTLDFLVTNSTSVRYIDIDNIKFQGANKGALMLGKSGSNVNVTNCDIEYSGENAVEIEGISNFKLEKSKITYTNNNGVVIKSSKNSIIRENLIKNTFLFPGQGRNGNGNGIAIRTDSDYNLIEYNEIINTGYSGISFHGNDVTVKNNLIDRFCLTTNDGGGIYTYSGRMESNRNRKIIGNIILNGEGVTEGAKLYNLLSKPQAEGIYIDDNASHVEVSDNTIAHMTSKGVYLHNANNIKVRNNTIFDNKHQVFLRNDNMGKPLENNTIENNQLLSKDAFQNHLQILSIYGDIKRLAKFNSNYYATPLIDNIRINTVSNTGSSHEKSSLFNLKSWQKKHDNDWSSKNFDRLDKIFTVKTLIGANKYDNGSFNKSLGYVGCANCTSSLDKSGVMNGGSLKIKSSGMSRTSVKVGSLEKGKQYVLKFKAKSNKTIGLNSYIRQDTDPWFTVTESHGFELSPSKNSYETFFTALADVKVGRLMFDLDQEESAEFYIDDLELHEARVEVVNPEEAILFEYNPTRNARTINLNGEYVDVKNNKQQSKITLQPYSSVLLIKKSNKTVEKPSQEASLNLIHPKNHANFTSGSEIKVTAELNDPSGSISEVEFYNGDKLIGSSKNKPYEIVWKDVPEGAYSLKARARVGNSSTLASSPVNVDVKKNTATSAVKEPVGDSDFSTIYLNTGTSADISHQGNKYIGDSKFSSYHKNSSVYANSNAISNKLFQTERNGKDLKYRIPLPSGTYTVKTYHFELWFGKNGPSAQAGRRVFDIFMEEEILKKDFDIFEENNNRPTELTFHNIEVKDGFLDIEMSASRDRASISAIAIFKNSDSVEDSGETKGTMFFNTGTWTNTSYKGSVFQGDEKQPSYYDSKSTTVHSTSSKDILFQTERYGRTLNYKIPVVNGMYTVQTYHNELWFGKFGPSEQAGRRVFNISVEGQLKKRNFDMFKENNNKPTVLTFENIEVKDGILNINMAASINNATISGIAIIPETNKVMMTSAKFRMAEVETEDGDEENADDSSLMTENVQEIKLYPNPAKDRTTLSLGRDIGLFEILVHNTNGQLVERLDPINLSVGNGEYVMPVHHLQKGVYLVTVVNKKEIVKRMRLIVAH